MSGNKRAIRWLVNTITSRGVRVGRKDTRRKKVNMGKFQLLFADKSVFFTYKVKDGRVDATGTKDRAE